MIPLNKVLSVRVPDWVYENIENLSKKLGKRRSEVILDVLIEGLRVLNKKMNRLENIEVILSAIRRSKLRIKEGISIVDIVSSERE